VIFPDKLLLFETLNFVPPALEVFSVYTLDDPIRVSPIYTFVLTLVFAFDDAQTLMLLIAIPDDEKSLDVNVILFAEVLFAPT